MNPERWVQWLRNASLIVFTAVPVFALLVPEHAGRVVWTIIVAALPLFIVLAGYHRWRKICPLAFVAQISTRISRPGKRKVPAFVETNYHYLVLGIFVISLWLRLIATNGNGAAIAAFFVLISAAALVTGFIFTGKTWCNHICPLSFVEKIYTEPNGLRNTPNSQCSKCTACKKSDRRPFNRMVSKDPR